MSKFTKLYKRELPYNFIFDDATARLAEHLINPFVAGDIGKKVWQKSPSAEFKITAVVDGVATFEEVGGAIFEYTPEDVANKSIDVIADLLSDIKYPSVKSVYDWVTYVVSNLTTTYITPVQNKRFVTDAQLSAINGLTAINIAGASVITSVEYTATFTSCALSKNGLHAIIVSGDGDPIHVTSNSGVSWDSYNITWTDGSGTYPVSGHIYDCHISDSGHITLCYGGIVIESSSGGVVFTRKTTQSPIWSGSINAQLLSLGTNHNYFLASEGANHVIYVDAIAKYSLLADGFVDIDVSADENVIIAITADSLAISLNGGDSFTKTIVGFYSLTTCAISGDGSVIVVAYYDNGLGVGGVKKSIDGGVSWTTLATGSLYFRADISDDGLVIIYTEKGNYAHLSIDGGISFTTMLDIPINGSGGLCKTSGLRSLACNDRIAHFITLGIGNAAIESNSNKITNFISYITNNTKYPSVKAVYDWAIGVFEPKVTIGDSSQYYRGDKTMQTLDKTAVGLPNVDNTSDVSKPVSNAAQAADTAILNAAKAYADGLVVGLVQDMGGYDASVNTFPITGGSGISGTVLKGDLWFASVAGTLGGTYIQIGSSFRALVDDPGQIANNWNIINTTLGFTPENSSNKSTDILADKLSDIKFPSTKAVYDILSTATSIGIDLSVNTVIGTVPTIVGSQTLPANTYGIPAALAGAGNPTVSITVQLRLQDGTVLSTISGTGGLYWRTANGGFTLAVDTIVDLVAYTDSVNEPGFIHSFNL